MSKKKKRRRRPAWHGEHRTGEALRTRRPYKSRRAVARGKTDWFLRTDNVFFWSGEWRELSLAGRAVLTVLLHLADGDDPYRWLYVSDPDLMHYTRCSRPTVYDALCNLIEHGCIEGERGGSQPGRYRLSEKVLRYSHGRRKKKRTRARPPAAKPPQKAKQTAKAEPPPDVGIEIPEDLAAAIKPRAWRRIIKTHPAQDIRDAVIVYRSEAKKEQIKKPLALFNHLLTQNWLADRAAEIAAGERQAAAAEARQHKETEKARETRRRMDAFDERVRRGFTQEQLEAYSDLALANLHKNDFAKRHIKRGSRTWASEMFRLIDKAAQGDAGTTQSETEADGADLPAVAAQAT